MNLRERQADPGAQPVSPPSAAAAPVGGPEGSLPLRPLRLTLDSLCYCGHAIMDHFVFDPRAARRAGCVLCLCTQEFEWEEM